MVWIIAGNRLAGFALLVLVLWENRRAVLRPDVIPLTVELRRVVRREKDVEQIVVAELVGIEGDADRLGVTGVAAAHLLVGRIGDAATGIAALDLGDSDHVEEHGFGAPETSTGEDCDFFGH